MHDLIEIFHLILHNAVKPHRRLLARFAVHDRAVHLRSVIDIRTVVILFLRLMNQVMLFSGFRLHRHSHIRHVKPDRALSSLDQHVVLRPVESGTIFQNGEFPIRELQADKEHIILVAELLASVRHISAHHDHGLRLSHDKLDTVQLMDMMIQMPA